jgi:hypothetical protein
MSTSKSKSIHALVAAVALSTVLSSACAGGAGNANIPAASDACDAEVRRKVTCDHLAPQLADRARDLCERSWTCAASFWRPEALAVWVSCNARTGCGIDCDEEVGKRVAPLPQETAFANACRSREQTCGLDCARLIDDHRKEVAGFWNDMSACFDLPQCGEPSNCLLHASERPAQALGCLF